MKDYKKSIDACESSWRDFPSQDNEGFVPDKVGFSLGWKSGIKWYKSTDDLVLLLKSCKAAMLYAYEDHADQYYLTVMAKINKFLGES